MNGAFMMIALVVAAAFLAFWIVKLASFWNAFTEETRFICHEMDCAHNQRAYRCWQRELRCHFLCLIPFVNKKNVAKVYRFLFPGGLFVQKQPRKDSLTPLLMPSLLGMCICLMCVCGMTWAWHTASIETPTQKMTAAYYEVTVETVMNGETKIEPNTDGSYSLEANTTYTITLKAGGSVKECGGYCLIENGDKTVTYYTQTFKPDETITIELRITQKGNYTFTGVWGSIPSAVDEADIYKDTPATADGS